MRRTVAVTLLVLIALAGTTYATRWQYPAGAYIRVSRWSDRVERFTADSGWRELKPRNPFQDLADEARRLDSIRADQADPFRDLRIDSARPRRR